MTILSTLRESKWFWPLLGVSVTLILTPDLVIFLNRYYARKQGEEDKPDAVVETGPKIGKPVSTLESAGRHRNPWFRNLPRDPKFFEKVSKDELWNTALFFPEIFPEEPGSQTQQMIWYMQQAKKTLKIAIYTTGFKLLENAVFFLAKNKVKVMVVTNTPKALRWRKRGILVREKPKTKISPHWEPALKENPYMTPQPAMYLDHMHHKFVIIDDQAVLTGSLNWTVSAIQENRENVLVTNDPRIVSPFIKEFDKLWEISDPRNNNKSTNNGNNNNGTGTDTQKRKHFKQTFKFLPK